MPDRSRGFPFRVACRQAFMHPGRPNYEWYLAGPGAGYAPMASRAIQARASESSDGTPRRRGRPRKNRADLNAATRAVILDAALQEFARNGFDGAGIAEIAKKSGVARALIHYHFSNKEALWKAAVVSAFRELNEHFNDIGRELRDLDAVAFLKVFIRRYTYFVARRPEVGRIVIAEAPRGTERGRWVVDRILRPMHMAFERMFREKIAAAQTEAADGPIRPIPFLNFLSMLTGAVSIYFLDAAVLQDHYQVDPADPDTIEAHADFVVETMLNGLLRGPGG